MTASGVETGRLVFFRSGSGAAWPAVVDAVSCSRVELTVWPPGRPPMSVFEASPVEWADGGQWSLSARKGSRVSERFAARLESGRLV